MKNGIVTLTYGKIAHLDATTGPTDWAGRSIEFERKMEMEGHAPAPPSESRRPGQIEAGYEIDATTGATRRDIRCDSLDYPPVAMTTFGKALQKPMATRIRARNAKRILSTPPQAQHLAYPLPARSSGWQACPT